MRGKRTVKTGCQRQLFRYGKLFLRGVTLSVMSGTIFRANFILMLIQSIMNSMIGILSVEFIYGSVRQIGGWGKDEMLVLICTSLVVNQTYRGLIQPNQRRFMNGVRDGSLDKMLLKPIPVLFQANTGRADISAILSGFAPLGILLYKAGKIGALGPVQQGFPENLVLFFVLLVNAVLVLAAFMQILYCLAFVFTRADAVENIYYMMMSMSDKPKEIWGTGKAALGFVFFIPAVVLANAPAAALLGKAEPADCVRYLAAGVLFAGLAAVTVKKGISGYSSTGS